MNWTQPICLDCYQVRYPQRDPVTIPYCEKETCCDCGRDTMDGIYFRVDPRTVKYPAKDEA